MLNYRLLPPSSLLGAIKQTKMFIDFLGVQWTNYSCFPSMNVTAGLMVSLLGLSIHWQMLVVTFFVIFKVIDVVIVTHINGLFHAETIACR